MDTFQKFASQVRRRQALWLLFSNGLVIGSWWYLSQVLHWDANVILWTLIALVTLSAVVLAAISTHYLIKPVKLIWQAVMHVAPETANTAAPNVKSIQLGQELVSNLISHIYQLAQVMGDVEKTAKKRSHNLKHDFVANSLPLPLVVLDKYQTVIFANGTMAKYLDKDIDDITGQNIYAVLDMSFATRDTFDKWLTRARADKAVDSHSWDRVRANVSGDAVRQFDLCAYYNKSNPEGFESMLVLFDHTERYGQDDHGLSFVALAVHELRTPVTLLKGYIDAFEEELSGKLDPELTDFMHKMKVSAQALTIFINNILNVARVENNQLTLKLQQEDWPGIVNSAVNDMKLRARVRNVELVTDISDNLPPVGIDSVSMYEVLNNLLDNAIKYSHPDGKIVVKASVTGDGLIETTVQDFGIGMPNNIVSSLFEKFYRSHRSKAEVSGTGLGLYLCKAIVDAHGGHIWVRSREGEGSTFGFTVKPYKQVASEQKSGQSADIVRVAHGWIKNHSLYRK